MTTKRPRPWIWFGLATIAFVGGTLIAEWMR
jgi:hypothetical protein